MGDERAYIQVFEGPQDPSVSQQLRNIFPGVGGTIRTAVPVPCVHKHTPPHSKGHSHRQFILGVLLRKLDDYFVRSETYRIHHIPRPYGSEEGRDAGHYEERINGQEQFSLYEPTPDGKGWRELPEWHSFTTHFRDAGFFVADDTVVPEGMASQNIVLQDGPLWWRIDTEDASMRKDYDRTLWYLEKYEEPMVHWLRFRRHQMMIWCAQYLRDRTLPEYEKGRLTEMLGGYRENSFYHLLSREEVPGSRLVEIVDDGYSLP